MTAQRREVKVSVQLRRLARYLARNTNELRVILALERMVARLHTSSLLRDHLVFKGGFTLLKTTDSQRFTRDLDALALKIPRERLIGEIINALHIDLDDAFWFGDFETDALPDHGDYEGLRVSNAYHIGETPHTGKIHKLSRAHLDIAFGDILPGGPSQGLLSSILPTFPPVSWSIYPLEFILAEKLETLVSRGSLNSRAKDYYDLNVIFERIIINSSLARTVSITFRHRNTALPRSFEAYLMSLDHRILRQAWRSVELTRSVSFDQCVSTLRTHLSQLDRVVAQRR